MWCMAVGRQRIRAAEGVVFTPPRLVDRMVGKLFAGKAPRPGDRVLDPGCGLGAFIDGVLRWCERRGVRPPRIVGVEIDAGMARACRARYRDLSNVTIVQGDFLLLEGLGAFDYVVGNPPYISIERLPMDLREKYKRLYRTATGRFDTYMLFFEKALRLLNPGGRLVFITPEKYLYVHSARALRRLLAQHHVVEVELVEEEAFGEILAYPAVTVVDKEAPGPTTFILRDGSRTTVYLPRDGSPWLGEAMVRLQPTRLKQYKHRLREICVRISAGVATGRDNIFVVRRDMLPEELRPYAWPTVSGEELARFKAGGPIDYSKLKHVMLVPYDREGRLLGEEEAKPLLEYLARHRGELEKRRAVRIVGKKWYAFHENPPMKTLAKPKILWRDVEKEPRFWWDPEGRIIPRHNVYYLVPRNPSIIPGLLEYLSSREVEMWIEAHAQRAANGYLRLQATLFKNLPIPESLYSKGVKTLSLRQLL